MVKRKTKASKLTMKNCCSMCGTMSLPLLPCGEGHVCSSCSEKVRVGRDSTTRAAKLKGKSARLQAEAARTLSKGGAVDEQTKFNIVSMELLSQDEPDDQKPLALGAGGEVLPQDDLQLRNTLEAPGAAALDASAHRMELVNKVGLDVTAMALDAANTIQARNSVEMMLAHQLAACHEFAMTSLQKASLESDAVSRAITANSGFRAMGYFQRGLMALKSLRKSSDQRITIKHVNVTEGGQAVFGQVGGQGGAAK